MTFRRPLIFHINGIIDNLPFGVLEVAVYSLFLFEQSRVDRDIRRGGHHARRDCLALDVGSSP